MDVNEKATEVEAEIETPEAAAPEAGAEIAPEMGSGDGGDLAAPQAQAADEWRPPSREEFERNQEEMKYLRDFRVSADRASEIIRRPAGPNTPPAVDPVYEQYFTSQQGMNKYLADLNTRDPRVAERAHAALNAKINAERFARFDKAEQEFAQYKEQAEQEFAQMRKFRRLAPHQYAESKKWQEHGKFVTEEVTSGRYNLDGDEAVEKALIHAFEIAALKASKAGASPAQAQAAGVKAAEKVAGKALPKPTPRSESSGGRPSSPVAVSSQVKLNTSDPQYWKKMGRAGVEEAERQLANERRR